MGWRILYEVECKETGERLSALTLFSKEDCLALKRRKEAETGLTWVLRNERVWE